MATAASQSWVLGILILLSVLQVVHASWWYLGVASSYQFLAYEVRQSDKILDDACASLQFLQPQQREICNHDVKLLEVISSGAAMGIEECQHQFRDRRWNCTTYNNTSVFGPVLHIKSRETAYIYAISSAGIMYSVTRACAKGELDKCGCDNKVRRLQEERGFQWGGCSDNIRYGARFSKDFVDSVETKQKDHGSMNLWNNGAGRKTIKDQIDIQCKCHGVSGDCSVRICWRKMRNFREIGAALKAKFDGASLVRFDKRRGRLKRVSGKQKRPTRKDLVYLADSPDFCEYNLKYGSLGTRGRQCNKTSYGLDGCTLMCCGRGYQTLVSEEVEDCDCKFYWCCKVVCKKCTNVMEKHYCN
ncbi:protein Wnt-4 [Aplysia californica]|uniref:Protein Wnt n=1 Tax=Aplysia californica TaxID=6500 RepID=A0ABM1W5C3_APLCA|nr:protein Wnt-4 [Aplysia californica]